MEELAKDAWFGLLVSHTLTPGGVVGVLVMMREALKRWHEARALEKGIVSTAHSV